MLPIRVIASATLFAATSVALAQAQQTTLQQRLEQAEVIERSEISFVELPNAADLRLIPSRTDLDNQGRVSLDCLIGINGRLECAVAEVLPVGPSPDIGDWALLLSQSAEVAASPEVVGKRFRWWITFNESEQ